MDPRAGLDTMEKRKKKSLSLAENRTPITRSSSPWPELKRTCTILAQNIRVTEGLMWPYSARGEGGGAAAELG
jgi:hypothetical protein